MKGYIYRSSFGDVRVGIWLIEEFLQAQSTMSGDLRASELMSKDFVLNI